MDIKEGNDVTMKNPKKLLLENKVRRTNKDTAFPPLHIPHNLEKRLIQIVSIELALHK